MTEIASNSWRGKLIVALLIVAALVGCFMLYAHAEAGTSARVLVHDGDGVVHEFLLSEDGEHAITSSFGVNTIAIQEGQVCMIETDCPNGDCKDQGYISGANQAIICLPHQLWVEIVEPDEEESLGQNGSK